MLLLYPKNGISLSVIITNHRYEIYLDEAIRSVIIQKHGPAEIILIDDDPIGNRSRQIAEQYQIAYHRVKYNNPSLARKHGVELANNEYVCFLDADDIMNEDYIQNIGFQINHDPDIIYSDITYFGDKNNTTNFPEEIDQNRIDITNFLHIGCAVKKQLLEGAFDFRDNIHEDWAMWRNVLAKPRTLIKQPIPYLARVHNYNKSKKIKNYHEGRGISTSKVTTVGKLNKKPDKLHCLEFELPMIPSIVLHGPKNYRLLGDIEHDVTWTTERQLDHLQSDYVFLYNEFDPPPRNICNVMLKKLTAETVAIHNSKYELLECTLVVRKFLNRIMTGDDREVLFI